MKNMKLNAQLFNRSETLNHVEMGACQGGANKSDVNYADTKRDGKAKWDIAVDSLIDTIDSSQSLDKPTTSSSANAFEYADM